MLCIFHGLVLTFASYSAGNGLALNSKENAQLQHHDSKQEVRSHNALVRVFIVFFLLPGLFALELPE